MTSLTWDMLEWDRPLLYIVPVMSGVAGLTTGIAGLGGAIVMTSLWQFLWAIFRLPELAKLDLLVLILTLQQANTVVGYAISEWRVWWQYAGLGASYALISMCCSPFGVYLRETVDPHLVQVIISWILLLFVGWRAPIPPAIRGCCFPQDGAGKGSPPETAGPTSGSKTACTSTNVSSSSSCCSDQLATSAPAADVCGHRQEEDQQLGQQLEKQEQHHQHQQQPEQYQLQNQQDQEQNHEQDEEPGEHSTSWVERQEEEDISEEEEFDENEDEEVSTTLKGQPLPSSKLDSTSKLKLRLKRRIKRHRLATPASSPAAASDALANSPAASGSPPHSVAPAVGAGVGVQHGVAAGLPAGVHAGSPTPASASSSSPSKWRHSSKIKATTEEAARLQVADDDEIALEEGAPPTSLESLRASETASSREIGKSEPSFDIGKLRWWLILSAIPTGILNGICGLGGPPYIILMAIWKVPKSFARPFFPLNIIFELPLRLVLILRESSIESIWADSHILLATVVSNFVFLSIGSRLSRRVSQQLFERVLFGVLLLSSLVALGLFRGSPMAFGAFVLVAVILTIRARRGL